MSPTWDPGVNQVLPRFGTWGRVRFALRFLPMSLVTFGGLGLLLLLRLVEWPVFRAYRPLSPWITQGVCRANLAILGISVRTEGRPMAGKGAMVANHSSWLDIFGLNSQDRIYFVAKREVAGWFGIGWLARSTGTVFVERRAQAAKRQQEEFLARLAQGHRLLFFPEGTSTDGMQVLDFKSTLFAAFFNQIHREAMSIQPVTQVYHAPEGLDPRFYGWWGDADFGPHFVAVLSAPAGGRIDIVYHEPLKVAAFEDRKDLARQAGEVVREGLEHRQAITSR